MPDDPIALVLAEYAERERKVVIGYLREPRDVPRLMAAVAAVAVLHAPTALVRYTEACSNHYASIHGRLECPHCVKVERPGCQTCRDEFGNPARPEDCKERAAILAALNGEASE